MTARGRPSEDDLTRRLCDAMVNGLARQGLEACRLDDVASAARTSKQAIYRRWPDKAAFARACLTRAVRELLPPPPERGTVARDLFRLVTYYETELFATAAGRALMRLRADPDFAVICAELEQDQRFAIRQVLIATPFERDMDARADLLIALIWQRAYRRGPETAADPSLESALYLILGLSPGPASSFVPLPERSQRRDQA